MIKTQIKILAISIFKYEIHKSLPAETQYRQGHDRTQTYLFPVSLDQSIDPDNEVRLIDLFADSLSLQEFGFKTDFVDNGRPAYHPADLLKLYIYGYLNKIRSSRDLEKEFKQSIF